MLVLLSLFMACSSSPPAPQAAPTPPPEAAAAPSMDPIAAARAKATMSTLGTTLKGRLAEKMAAEGPLGALDGCSQDAQSLTAGVAADADVRVGRSSLRLRNPANAASSWVQTWLETTGERPAEGVTPSMSRATLPDGQAVIRVVAPLPIEAPCLICHGPADGRAADLAAAIIERYPSDAANGYALGDLRGAIWAEAPIIDTGLDLIAPGASKWELDDSTRDTMADIRTALASAPTDLAAAHASAAGVEAAVTRMISGCSMTGPDHDALHEFLMVLFPAIEGFKDASTLQEAITRRGMLLALVFEFDAAFA